MYDRHCLVPQHQQDESMPHVLRFRIPEAPSVVAWDDAVRGRLEFAASTLDDFVALKADGYPTYHFANVVDDHLMAISHVLRADEWIPSTPKHLLLFRAFGWDAPVYAHLPAVQGPSGGKKLSKRDGAQSVEEYIAEGYLPEALRSFLASLGWNDGTTQEVYSTPELIEKFSLERIQKSPARFDKDRLIWMNGHIIRELPLSDLAERADGFWPASATGASPSYRTAVLGLVQERLKFLAELPELTDYFFVDPEVPAALLQAAVATFTSPQEAREALEQAMTALDALEPFDEAHISTALSELEGKLSAAAGRPNSRKQLYGIIRTVVTGQPSSPQLMPMLAVLGRDHTLGRLRRTFSLLSR